MLRAHNAAESVRQRQQGYGRPIVSWVDHGNRFVAVGDTLFWQKNWLVFTDFSLLLPSEDARLRVGLPRPEGKKPSSNLPLARKTQRLYDQA
jgi:hypothetical protein